MKSAIKIFICLVLLVSMQAIASAQTTGYSITDNDQDATLRRQQLYKINVVTGVTNYMGDLVIGPAGAQQQLIREYEGFASIGSTLYAVAEYAPLIGNPQLCNTGADPITGLSVDLRTFRVGPIQTVPDETNPTPAPIANASGLNTVVGPQIGETCIDFGTESALGYNAVDGFFYSIASDDLLPAGGIRSRLYRISPSTGIATLVADIDNPGFVPPVAGDSSTDRGDDNTYLDGLTILPNGFAYATAFRFSADPNPADADNRDFGGLYRVFLSDTANPNVGDPAADNKCPQPGVLPIIPAGSACLIKHLIPTALARDTGLANRGTTLVVLNERGQIHSTSVLPNGAVSPAINMFTPGATHGAGGGAAGQRIEGCRGAVATTAEFEPGAALSVGGCRDFEGLDIPTPGLF